MTEPSRYQFSPPRLLLRSLRHTFDYTGRSTRTEVVLWIVIAPLFAVLVGWALLVLSLPVDARIWAIQAINILFLVPLVALMARRLNDQDRTRWWLLLLPVGLVDEALGFLPGEPVLLPWVDGALNLVAFAGLFALMFLESGAPGENRFGPNPREVATS